MEGFNDKIKVILSNSSVHIAFLTVLSVYIIFWKLGEGSLSPTEARYAEVAKQILRTGDWITLQFNYQLFIGKPPLYYWLTAIIYKFIGISEFSARFWSATFAVGTVIATYLLGKKLFGKLTGFISALILLTTPQFTNYWGYVHTHSGRGGTLDTMVTFFIILSIYFFWIGRSQSKYLVLSGITIGLGVMTKSVVGLIPFFIIFLFIIFTRELKIFREKNLYKGILCFLVVIIPWHALATIANGMEFLTKSFFGNVVGRATSSGVMTSHNFFYIDTIKHGFYPWSIFVLFAILYIAKNAVDEKKKENILLLFWIATVLAIFTYSKFKLPHYIIPVYPALAICVAQFFEGFIKIKKDGLIFASMLIAFALWLSFMPVIKYLSAGIGFDFDINDVNLIKGLAISFAVLFLYSTVGRLNRLKTGLSLLIVGIIIASALHFPVINDRSHDVKEVASVMGQVSEPDAVLMLYNLGGKYDATIFYSDRRVWNMAPTKKDRGFLLQFLNSSKTEFALMKASDYEEIKKPTYKILANYEDILLFTNNNTILLPQ